MKFIFSFFVAFSLMFGCAVDAQAHTVRTTVIQKVCSTQKQPIWRLTRRGFWVLKGYRKIVVCRTVPRTVVRRAHHHRRRVYQPRGRNRARK